MRGSIFIQNFAENNKNVVRLIGLLNGRFDFLCTMFQLGI
jgi:hypothetical protein